MADASIIFFLMVTGLLGSVSITEAVKYVVKDDLSALVFSGAFAALAMLNVAYVIIGVRQ